jgi:nucleoside 2-deoxyribosyltransferase
VFVIMSFKREFRDVFSSCRDVCQEFRFEAERTDESTSLERIVPRIEAGIRRSAFVIADVSELGPNVFYEIGYAKGLGKDVILTARKGTELPFDIDDIPTIFWEIQEDLKEGLRKALGGLVRKYGRSAAVEA